MPHPWICPFCPLHCEDVKIERQDDGARTIVPDCSLAQAALNRLNLDRTEPRAARIKGTPVDWQAAVRYVAERIDAAAAIAIRGSLTGIGTARTILTFAEQFDAAIDHDACESQNALRRTIAREGVFSATLGDVRRFADLVVLIGCPEEGFPRLADRFFGDGLVDGRSRRIVSIDSPTSRRFPSAPTVNVPAAATLDQLTVASERFSGFLAAVRMYVQGQTVDQVPGLDEQTLDPLRKLTDWLDAANYVAVVLGPTALDSFGPTGAEVESSGLISSIASLNQERRAVLLCLDPSLSFRQVALWRAGFSGPIVWQHGVPRGFETGQFAATWKSAETARLRIECSPGAEFAGPGSAGRSGGPGDRSATAEILVAVEGTGEEAARDADVFLPIAAPGIGLADTVVRGDGSVSLPLKPLRSPLEPTLAETLLAITQACRLPTGTTATKPSRRGLA